jgi:dipeptidyl aminopeptidase/acylaminoacyl peptidase
MDYRSVKGACTATLLAFVLVTPVAGQSRGFAPTDYYRLSNVGQVAMAPSGDLVAFTVTTVAEAENRRHREIWIQRLEAGRPSGDPYRLTSPTEESSDPAWSPDGALLSFKSKRGDDPNDVWFLRMDTAAVGEAFHIAGVEGAPRWSPDGSRIAFTRVPEAPDADGSEREGWIAEDAVTLTLDPDRFDGRVITSLRYKRDGTSDLLPDPSARGKRQLFVVPSEGGESRQLTRGPFDVDDVTWAANSLHLFFAGDELEDDAYRTEPDVDLWVVSAAGGSARRVADAPGSQRSPVVSPDGTRLAWLTTSQRGAETDVWVAELGPDGTTGTASTNVTENWPLEPGPVQWSADGLTITWGARIGGNVHAFRTAASGGGVQQVTEGDRQLRDLSLSRDGAVMAYAATDVTSPVELFVARGDGSEEVQATAFNDALAREITLMDAERITWTVQDGSQVEGWIIKPVGFDAGRRYPLVLKIHGGPHSAYGNRFFPTFHVLSAAGFFVLYTNPRGSAGYGNAFEYATRGQWGILDREDFLTGLDATLARYPEVDPDRLGVSGGSYGGFMTNWLTATTDRFSAAVTSRSISNWESWWGTSDVPGLTEFEFGGAPWEQRDLYRRLSPISYVENVTAPTLVIHSEHDYRTPMQDAEQWYLSLKKRGIPAELVRYPRSSHGLSRTGEPWLLVDRLERIRSWFVHFLIDEAGAVTASR